MNQLQNNNLIELQYVSYKKSDSSLAKTEDCLSRLLQTSQNCEVFREKTVEALSGINQQTLKRVIRRYGIVPSKLNGHELVVFLCDLLESLYRCLQRDNDELRYIRFNPERGFIKRPPKPKKSKAKKSSTETNDKRESLSPPVESIPNFPLSLNLVDLSDEQSTPPLITPTAPRLCRQCRIICPKQTRSFCSESCLHWYKIQSCGSYVRRCILIRDKGVCDECHLDCETLRKSIHKLTSKVPIKQRDEIVAKLAESVDCPLLNALKSNRRGKYPRGRFWQADHILAVCEGGGMCYLENYRTLCIDCHKNMTRILRQGRSIHKSASVCSEGGLVVPSSLMAISIDGEDSGCSESEDNEYNENGSDKGGDGGDDVKNGCMNRDLMNCVPADQEFRKDSSIEINLPIDGYMRDPESPPTSQSSPKQLNLTEPITMNPSLSLLARVHQRRAQRSLQANKLKSPSLNPEVDTSNREEGEKGDVFPPENGRLLMYFDNNDEISCPRDLSYQDIVDHWDIQKCTMKKEEALSGGIGRMKMAGGSGVAGEMKSAIPLRDDEMLTAEFEGEMSTMHLNNLRKPFDISLEEGNKKEVSTSPQQTSPKKRKASNSVQRQKRVGKWYLKSCR